MRFDLLEGVGLYEYGLRTISKFRTDIQALRGFAVSLVLIYHADFGFLKAGFLGVDVFL